MSDITQPRIIGLAGTFASGKDTVADFLVREYHFAHFSTGDIIRQEAQRLRGSIERPILFEVGNKLRHERGAGVFAELALQQFRAVQGDYGGAVISGLRSLGEAKAIKAAGGTIVFVDAPVEMRYQRMIDRQRDTETQLTLEAFRAQESKELQAPVGDEATINILGVKAQADIVIINDADLSSYLAKVRQALHF